VSTVFLHKPLESNADESGCQWFVPWNFKVLNHSLFYLFIRVYLLGVGGFTVTILNRLILYTV
jgi:hypothetical protein